MPTLYMQITHIIGSASFTIST